MVTGMDRPSPSWTPAIAIFNTKCRFPDHFRDDPAALDKRSEPGDEDPEEFTAEW